MGCACELPSVSKPPSLRSARLERVRPTNVRSERQATLKRSAQRSWPRRGGDVHVVNLGQLPQPPRPEAMLAGLYKGGWFPTKATRMLIAVAGNPMFAASMSMSGGHVPGTASAARMRSNSSGRSRCDLPGSKARRLDIGRC